MELLIYLVKVSVCTVLFFAFYLLFLRRLTFFKINRFYLLFTLLISFIIPTLSFTIEREVEIAPMVYTQVEPPDEVKINEPITAISPIETRPITEESFDYYSLLPYLYFSIVFSLLVIATWRILQLLKHTKNGAKRISGLKIFQKSSGFTNCSFFNYVFIDEKLSEAELQVLIKHEEVHAKQFHSIDKIIMMLIKAFLWFNPVVYLYDKALEQAHEYEADEATSQNFGTEQYASLLLRLAIAKSETSLVHNFVKSPIKDRIKMLFHSKSKNMKKLIYLLAVPIGLILLWSFTVKVVEVAKFAEVTELNMRSNVASQIKKSNNDPLWNTTIRGKVKSILLTEVGEVLNFKYDKGIIRVLTFSRGNVSVGDEVLITIGGTVNDIKISDSKGNVVKQLDGPCYSMDRMKTLDEKVLFDIDNRPFLSKSAVMQYGQYKSEKFTLHTVSGKIPSLRIVHSPIGSEPSKVFIYANGKLYSEKETLKFDKKFIASLSEKRGFAKAADYDIPTITNRKKTYIFWFGKEPKFTAKTAKSRNFSQKHKSEKVNGQLAGLINSSKTKTLDGFLIKNNLETIKPILLRSTSITVDTKADIAYVKDGVYKIGDIELVAKESTFDKTKNAIKAVKSTITKNGHIIVSDEIIVDVNLDYFKVKEIKEPFVLSTFKKANEENSHIGYTGSNTKVRYSAIDSINLDKKDKIIKLYGNATIANEKMRFKGSQILYNAKLNIETIKDATFYEDKAKVTADIMEVDFNKSKVISKKGDLRLTWN
ncbi:M56 family metallopeptidase [Pedobacter cryotolerans]|uniref:M56 family metallopeptidase n=1 Tax=Pedobacter cryotolerans TaxID=2571270 RepID=A0A4V5P1A7_9SPHI|nr:M56 family metallopeptidase [Pedobacter cryotolerans]TKC01907.1 M56 family metallopeptidase [Pedobacter cryotolerans]